MTFRERIRDIANPVIFITTQARLLDGDLETKILQHVENSINEQAKEIGYDGFTWDSPSEEYPDVIYGLLKLTIYKSITEYLEANHPQAWFKDFYKS